MRRVRAYTFDFCSFLYIIFAVLLKSLQRCAVCLAEHVSEPEYESSFQIWCESVQYWRCYRPLTYTKWWQLPCWILAEVNFDNKSSAGTPFSAYVSNLVQRYATVADLPPKM